MASQGEQHFISGLAGGNRTAVDAVLPLTYAELKRVEVRFNSGLPVEKTTPTVKREWAGAKVWLCRVLAGSPAAT